MIFDEIKEIKSSPSDLKQFGITLGIFFGVIAGILCWRGRPSFPYLIVLTVFFLGFGFLAPKILKPIQKVWMTVAVLMGWVMARLILTILFYFVITPIGIIIRITGRDLLNADFGRKKETYWQDRRVTRAEKSDYERQF